MMAKCLLNLFRKLEEVKFLSCHLLLVLETLEDCLNSLPILAAVQSGIQVKGNKKTYKRKEKWPTRPVKTLLSKLLRELIDTRSLKFA